MSPEPPTGASSRGYPSWRMQAPPRDQHVVSQVLQRRFQDPSTGLVQAFDLRGGFSRPRSTRAVGKIFDFIHAGSAAAAEARWAAMENRLPAALRAVDDGTVFQSAAHLASLRECMAIHWGRSRTSYTVDRDISRPTAYEQVLQELIQVDEFQVYFIVEYRTRRGRDPETLGDLLEIAREMHPFPDKVADNSFTDFVFEAVDEMERVVAATPIELAVAGGTQEFVLGDIPVLTLDRRVPGGAGPLRGVPLGPGIDTVVLPLGPRHLMTLGGVHGSTRVLNDGQVLVVNAHQILAAQERIIFRPGLGLDEPIRRLRGLPAPRSRHAGRP